MAQQLNGRRGEHDYWGTEADAPRRTAKPAPAQATPSAQGQMQTQSAPAAPGLGVHPFPHLPEKGEVAACYVPAQRSMRVLDLWAYVGSEFGDAWLVMVENQVRSQPSKSSQ